MSGTLRNIQILLAIAVIVNIAFWTYARPMKAQWINVPPVPSEFRASFVGLGDTQFSYRVLGIMIQNLGNTGGRDTAIKDYDFERLGRWFELQHQLDSRSNFIPLLAAFYFGASQDPSKIKPLIDYLETAGTRDGPEKWRWLAHGAYLARFKMKDRELALRLARKLSNLPTDLPLWARQMPVNILNEKGEKEAAFELILELLKSSKDTLHPNEVNAMIDYLCTRILDETEASRHDLCIALNQK